jgi:hypothetical protein
MRLIDIGANLTHEAFGDDRGSRDQLSFHCIDRTATASLSASQLR